MSLYNVYYGKKDISRDGVTEFLKGKEFRVIDVGGIGSVNFRGVWAGSLVTVVLDRKRPNYKLKQILHLGDVETAEGWEETEADVEKNGKFDFAICTHLLEDLRCPKFVCSKLGAVAKRGFIATPSKYRELKRGLEKDELGIDFRGYFHHWWIFTVINGEFWGLPKLGWIENDPFFDSVRCKRMAPDFSFWWDDEIVLKEYLAPPRLSGAEYVAKYREMLRDDISML